jgi:hypothetical protein
LAINSISINTIIGFLLKRKEREVEIAKEVFRKQARAEKRLPYIRGQKNTILRSNRRGNSLAKNININISRYKLDKLET